MSTATVHANGRVNGRVNVTLPNISILVDRQDAEGLRDALNAELPLEQAAAPAARERDLMLDPTIRDIDVLRAAQAIATEHECHGVVKQLAHMVTLYCDDDVKRCALCRCDATEAKHGISVCSYHYQHGEDDPPCPTCTPQQDETFVPGHVLSDVTAPRIRWVSDAWVNGRNATIETKERRVSPAITERTYTVEAYVLNRHRLPERRHSKRFPNHTDAETAADRWTRMAEWPGATEARDLYDPPAEVVDDNPVAVGDRVRDPMDGRWRTVTRIEGETVYMADGGCMSADECGDIRLPGEDLD